MLAPTSPARTKGKGRQMEASYEVVGGEVEEEENGEEVREMITGFMKSQVLRTGIAAAGFVMSVVGIWGDGTSRVVYIEV